MKAEKIPAETRAKIPVLNKVIPFANQIGCILVLILVVTIIACSRGGGSGGGRASPVSDFNYELTKDGQGIIITGYTGNGGKVIIPSIIEDYPVTAIAYMSLRGQNQTDYFAANNITELVIPKSVETLSSFAFYWIDNLKIFTLPDGIKVLPSSVFGADIQFNLLKTCLTILTSMKK